MSEGTSFTLRSHRAGTLLLGGLLLPAVILLATPGSARGQNIDLKGFDPVPGPYGILGVHTTRTLDQLTLYAGTTASYANDLLVGFRGDTVVMRPVAHRVVAELALALGLFSWLEAGLSLPVILRQLGENYPDPGSKTATTGLGDLRLVAKGRILAGSAHGGVGLALVAELTLPTGRADTFMRGQTASFSPRLVLDYRHPRGFVVALNLGARIRRRQEVGDLAVGSELRIGLGGEAPLGPTGLSFVAEIMASVGLARPVRASAPRVSAQTSPVEALFALRYRHSSGLMLSAGAGLGLTAGYGAPDVRALFSVGYTVPLRGASHSRAGASRLSAASGASSARHLARRPAPKPGVARRALPIHPGATPSAGEPGPRKLSDAAFDRAASRDPDPDADGIPTSRDRCPNEPEDMDGFQDTDGCPDLDNDRDGVPDSSDKCPNRPEVVNGVQDDDGCPDKGASGISMSGSRLKIGQRIFFHPGSSKLVESAFPILRQVAAFLKAHWRVRRVRIEGHTDSRGDKEKNVDLSVRRAYRVRAFLVAQGVAAGRLVAKGYGPKKPIASNWTQRGRSKNRRVVFVVEKIAPLRGASQGARRGASGKRRRGVR